jgi:hypothetical protein
LAIEIPELTHLLTAEGLDVSILGFQPAEIEQLQTDFEKNSSDPEDAVDPTWAKDAHVTQTGDMWTLGNHHLLCGAAQNPHHVGRLMGGSQADMAFLDPPYNVRIAGVVGRGKTKHAEFAMASEEMTPEDYIRFLGTTLGAAAAVLRTRSRQVQEHAPQDQSIQSNTGKVAFWLDD